MLEQDEGWWVTDEEPLEFIPEPEPRLFISSFETRQAGRSGVYGPVLGAGQVGASRVQNSIEGYNAYVGIDELPDLLQPPAAFSQTLPFNIPLGGGFQLRWGFCGSLAWGSCGTLTWGNCTSSSPDTGPHAYFVLVRRQDTYGIESQNQYYTRIQVDGSGALILNPVPPPQGLRLFPLVGGSIRVLAEYPGFGLDEAPATLWKVWAGPTVPIPATDSPASVTPVTDKVLALTIGPFSPGTIYVAVGLYRESDGNLSTTLTGSVELPVPPGELVAVPSGFDQL